MTAPAIAAHVEALLYTTRQAAALLGVSASTLNHARTEYARDVAAGRIPASIPWILIGRSVFYKRADVLAWVEKNAIPCGVAKPVCQ